MYKVHIPTAFTCSCSVHTVVMGVGVLCGPALKGNNFSLTFRPVWDALVVFSNLALKTTGASGRNIGRSFPLKLVYREPFHHFEASWEWPYSSNHTTYYYSTNISRHTIFLDCAISSINFCETIFTDHGNAVANKLYKKRRFMTVIFCIEHEKRKFWSLENLALLW